MRAKETFLADEIRALVKDCERQHGVLRSDAKNVDAQGDFEHANYLAGQADAYSAVLYELRGILRSAAM